METIALNLYSIDELSDDARKRAIEDERNRMYDWDTPWLHEYQDSYDAFCSVFSVELDRDGDYRRSTMDENVLNLSGNRLRTYLVNNYSMILDKDCPFTGFCGDESLLLPIRQFVARPEPGTDFDDLLRTCCYSLSRALESEHEYFLSDEGIVEELRSRDCQFTENGKLFY